MQFKFACLIWTMALLWSSVAMALPLRMPVMDMPLFVEQNSQGEVSGYAIDLADTIASAAGYQIQPLSMPVARMLADVHEHPGATLTILNRTAEREEDYFWITPLVASPVTLFVRSDSPLAGKADVKLSEVSSVSVVRNEYRHTLLQAEHVNNIMALKNWTHAVEAVLKNRVEGVLFSPLGLALICHEEKLDCSNLVPVVTLQTQYSYLAMPRVAENQVTARKLMTSALNYKNSPEFVHWIGKVQAMLDVYGQKVEARDGILHLAGYYPEIGEDQLWVIAAKAPYFVELDERGRLQGYGAHLVSDILAEAHVPQHVLIAPWPRILRESVSKSNVMAFAITRTPERESLFYWITPLTSARQGLYGLGSQKFATVEDLPGDIRVSGLSDDYRMRRSHEAGLQTLEFNTIQQAIEAVYNNEADLVFTSSAGLALGCVSLGRNCSELQLAVEVEVSTTYLVLSRLGTDLTLVERFKLAAARVKQSEEYQQWSKDWSIALQQQGLEQHIVNGVVNVWPQGKNE